MNRSWLWLVCILIISVQTSLSSNKPSIILHAHSHQQELKSFFMPALGEHRSYFSQMEWRYQSLVATYLALQQDAQPFLTPLSHEENMRRQLVQKPSGFDVVGVVKSAQQCAQEKQERLAVKQKQVQEKLNTFYPFLSPSQRNNCIPETEKQCELFLQTLPVENIQPLWLAHQADSVSLQDFFTHQSELIEIVTIDSVSKQNAHTDFLQEVSQSVYQEKRNHAYQNSMDQDFALSHQTYTLPCEIERTLQQQAIDPALFTQLESTALGHELFSELHTETQLACFVHKDAQQALTLLYAQTGAHACHEQEYDTAAQCVDLLHAWNSYALAVGKGVVLGIKDVIEGYNPVTLAQAVTHIAQGTGWLIEQATELITQYFQDYDEFSLRIDKAYNSADLLFQQVIHYISSTAGPQLLEDGVRFVVSMTNVHKSIINAGLLTLEKTALAGGRYINGAGKIVNFAHELEQCQTVEHLAQIQKQAIPIQEFYGGSKTFRTVHKVEAAKTAQKSLRVFRKQEVVQEIQKCTQKLVIQEKLKYGDFLQEGQRLYAILSKDIKMSREYKNLGDLYKQYKNIKHTDLPIELQKLSKANAEKVAINLEHIFAAEIVKTKNRNTMSVSGFHHDPDYFMQKLDSVMHFPQESIEHLGDGFYNACITIDSHIPSSKQTKTFFPAHWTREEVMECIVSRLKNAEFIKKTVDKYGEKWIFISQYNAALNIKYIFDTESFCFKSIFPIKK